MKHSPESQSNGDQVEPALHRSSEQSGDITIPSPRLFGLFAIIPCSFTHHVIGAVSCNLKENIYRNKRGRRGGGAKHDGQGKTFPYPTSPAAFLLLSLPTTPVMQATVAASTQLTIPLLGYFLSESLHKQLPI